MTGIEWASMPHIFKVISSCPSLRYLKPWTPALSRSLTTTTTTRFSGLKKDAFEDLMRTVGIPGQYFCQRSFATWYVQLPTKEQASKLAESSINTKFFRFQSEYIGTKRISVTTCNVLANFPEVMASNLSTFG